MNEATALLLQIQNLQLALQECKVIRRTQKETGAYDALVKKLDELKKTCPVGTVSTFDRLISRYSIAVSPMINNTCTGCFMKLPVGEANRVTAAHDIINCPNCNRFLYFEEQTEKAPEYDEHYQGIARFSLPELMCPDIQGKNKTEVLTQAAKMMTKTGFIANEELFTQKLLDREKLFSTAMGLGIAFPHARGTFAKGVIFSLALSKGGIDFGGGEIVHIIAVFAVPTQVNMFYLDIVSKLAKYFCKKANADKLLSCETPEAMWKMIVRLGL